MIFAVAERPRRPLGRGGLALLALLAAPVPGSAAAEPAGAAACTGCHSPRADGPVPGLAGRPAVETAAAMAAFRAGAREATVMDRIAKGFSDEEIRAIAEWFATGADEPRAAQP